VNSTAIQDTASGEEVSTGSGPGWW